MIWHLLRYIVTFSLPAFYKKIQGKNINNIKVKGPVVIAMNHPNAFADPVCFTFVAYPVRTHYLARGDAFKPGIISKILENIGIVPIFRLRDGGKEGLSKNDESYIRVNKLLKKNAKIIIFAEGLCIQERRLRPLKKGVSRMVFGAHEFLENKDLIVIPVGVNYSNPSKFRSKLFYNVGTPIKVSDFYDAYPESDAKRNTQFLQLLDTKLRGLITHINAKENDKVILQLEEMVMKDWISKLNLDPGKLEDEFKITQHLTEIINNLDVSDPVTLNELKLHCDDYYHDLKRNKLRDWLIDPLNKNKISELSLIIRFILIFLGLPFHIIGYIGAYLPYKLTEKATKKLVKRNKEFYASIAIGIGSFVFLFNFLAWFFILDLVTELKFAPLIGVLILATCSWFSMNFHFFIIKTLGILRINRNKELYSRLAEKRKKIIQIINNLTNF